MARRLPAFAVISVLATSGWFVAEHLIGAPVPPEGKTFLKLQEQRWSDGALSQVIRVAARRRSTPTPKPSPTAVRSVTPTPSLSPTLTPVPTPPAGIVEDFSSSWSLQEAGSMGESASSRWWVNSGAYLNSSAGLGASVLGTLNADDYWARLYAQTNPTDTDGGAHPQNIFRLVERDQWLNFSQYAYFRIRSINLSSSPNRNASNGFLLFNRYQSGDDLYYVGVRVDGAVVIKKKYKGTYYTMAYAKVFPGAPYDRTLNPNLLPLNKWMGIRADVQTLPDGSVSVDAYTDVGWTGTWIKVLSSTDRPGQYGPNVISTAGYSGVRTDFMDMEISSYRIERQ